MLPPTPIFQNECDNYGAVWDLRNVQFDGRTLAMFGLSDERRELVQQAMRAQWLVTYKHHYGSGTGYPQSVEAMVRFEPAINMTGLNRTGDEHVLPPLCKNWVEGTTVLVSTWVMENYFHGHNDNVLAAFADLYYADSLRPADLSSNRLFLFNKDVYDQAGLGNLKRLLGFMFSAIDRIESLYDQQTCFRRLLFGRGPLLAYQMNRDYSDVLPAYRRFMHARLNVTVPPRSISDDCVAVPLPRISNSAAAHDRAVADPPTEPMPNTTLASPPAPDPPPPPSPPPPDPPPPPTPPPPKRGPCHEPSLVYVRRSDREISNGDELLGWLGELGYKARVLDVASLEALAQDAVQADVFIGIHGAGLTNVRSILQGARVRMLLTSFVVFVCLLLLLLLLVLVLVLVHFPLSSQFLYARPDSVFVELRPEFRCDSMHFVNLPYLTHQRHFSVFLPFKSDEGFVRTGDFTMSVPRSFAQDLVAVLDHIFTVRDLGSSLPSQAEVVRAIPVHLDASKCVSRARATYNQTFDMHRPQDFFTVPIHVSGARNGPCPRGDLDLQFTFDTGLTHYTNPSSCAALPSPEWLKTSLLFCKLHPDECQHAGGT